MSSRSRELWSSRTNLRRWLLIAATAVTIFGLLHHLDHVVRGNHSGWPFEEEVSPFTFSLLIYALLIPGLYLTFRDRLMAGYWLFTAVVLFTVVTLAHFVGSEREAPIRDIYAVYASPTWGFLALLDLAAIYASLAVLAGVAIVVLRRGERGSI
jgi:Zn-dependent membrane protease YugP